MFFNPFTFILYVFTGEVGFLETVDSWVMCSLFWILVFVFKHIQVFYDSPASASQIAETTGIGHRDQIIFIFLAEMGFHHVGQTSLELLTF